MFNLASVMFAGFHSPPSPDSLQPYVKDGVEFGFTIFPEYRRKGYAIEAIKGVIHWAYQTHNINSFIVSVSPNNTASKTLVKRLGFIQIGEFNDEEDGLEHIMLLQGDALKELILGKA